jgi:hypothetical protein
MVLAPVAQVAQAASLAEADLEAKVARAAAGLWVEAPDLEDLAALADSAALVVLAWEALVVLAWEALVVLAWEALVACEAAHRQNGWPNEPSASIATAMAS